MYKVAITVNTRISTNSLNQRGALNKLIIDYSDMGITLKHELTEVIFLTLMPFPKGRA